MHPVLAVSHSLGVSAGVLRYDFQCKLSIQSCRYKDTQNIENRHVAIYHACRRFCSISHLTTKDNH